MIPEEIQVGGRDIPVWPAGQKIELLAAPNMGVTDFADRAAYHPRLAGKILEMEHDPRFHDWIFRGGCGTKVRDPHLWACVEADLVHARAMKLAAIALGAPDVVVDDCWANIYRHGDYCLPHSHLRAAASVIYLLDPGDQPADDPAGGRLCFSDPRIPFCCAHEEGRMTQLLMPELVAGSLLIFPALYIHLVNPYTGTRPRVTMSWNINLEKLPGDRADGWTKSPAGAAPSG
jgi:hypothetical protein